MKKFIMLAMACLLLYVPCSVFAAKKAPHDRNWHVGMLLLKNGEMLTGKIHYDYKTDLLQIAVGERLKAFSPQAVKLFRFYDEDFQLDRVFQNIELVTNSGYKRQGFYELLELGAIPLLGKLKYADKNASEIAKGEMLNTAHYHQQTQRFSLIYEYFILKDGQLIPLQSIKSNVWKLVADRAEELEKFKRKKGLRIHRTADLILMIKYYNTLKEADSEWLTELFSSVREN